MLPHSKMRALAEATRNIDGDKLLQSIDFLMQFQDLALGEVGRILESMVATLDHELSQDGYGADPLNVLVGPLTNFQWHAVNLFNSHMLCKHMR